MLQSVLTVRMDANLKNQFDTLCKEFGMNASTAITVFAKTVVREKKIPFSIAAQGDPFWNENNQKHLQKAISDITSGKYTVHDTIEIDND